MKRYFNLGLTLIFALGIGLLLPSASGPQDPSPLFAIGQSTTLLPDGRWLMAGGEVANGPSATALILNPHTNESVKAANQLKYPRSWHTATLLPDGTVLIFGGIGVGGQVISSPEIFDPITQKFSSISSSSLPARAYHTTTLLTDGRLLIAGGISDKGSTLSTARIWDPVSQSSQLLSSKFTIARYSQTATLLPDGKVLLWGGMDKDGNPLNNGELYDSSTNKFSLVETFTMPDDGGVPELTESIPVNGATDVPVDTIISLRFSEPLYVETVNAETVTLAGPNGLVKVKVIPAELGMLAFITPNKNLDPGTTYTLKISGPTDQRGFSLPDTSFTFTTKDKLSDDEEWDPSLQNLGGDWSSNRRESPWQALPPLQAEEGVTALSGQALKQNGEPLTGVILQIEKISTKTDTTGRFLLKSISPGRHVMVIDGQTANRSGKTYGLFEVGVSITEGQTNTLPYTIWMPKIDTAHAARIPSPITEEITVTTPKIPGLELRIPSGAIIRDRNGKEVTSISITPIPVDRTPFPLPSGIEIPVYFTIQPGAATVETISGKAKQGARFIYPNYTNVSPELKSHFWRYDPKIGAWHVYGMGKVTSDGKQVIPDKGVEVYKFSEVMFSPPPRLGGNTAPDSGPVPGSNSSDGDPVDLGTGLFVMRKTDLLLPDLLPIALTRTYRQNDTVSRPFGIGATHPYELFLVGDTTSYTYADLILPDGGRVHYVRISAGSGYTDAIFEHTATPTQFYKSQMKWNGKGWDLTLKDGTLYVFGEAAPLQSIRDRYGNRIVITRASVNSFGSPTGNITLITSPNGRWVEFTYDISNRITQAKDNLGRIVSYTYDASGRLLTVTDPMGGMTGYTYDASHRMLTIKDAKGIVFLTNVYDANGHIITQTQADGTVYQFRYVDKKCLSGSATSCDVISFDGKIRRAEITGPNGNVRRVDFTFFLNDITFNDPTGYPLSDIRALGKPEQQTITYERQAGTNFILSVTDPLSRKTAYTYDIMGNVTAITRLSGTAGSVITTFTYEPTFNRVASITDPLNHTTSLAYDTHGNLISMSDPIGNITTLGYNIVGQPVSITDPLGNTTSLTYQSGDLASISDPLGNRTTRFIDSGGRLLSLTNPLEYLTRYNYDSLNRLTSVTDPLGGLTSFSYDANGNLLGVTDARGSNTAYAYDNMDRLSNRRDPLLRSEGYTYDLGGNLTQFADRKAQATTFTYDSLNRRTKATYADLSATTYTYDAGNRLTQAVDSISGTISFTYDNLDRLTSETTPQGAVSYTYDQAGRRTSMTVAGQSTVNYNYDNTNRLTQITQGTSTVIFTYDQAGKRRSITLPNGVLIEYTYDNASRITAITYKKGATTLGDLTYTYDAAGNRIQTGGLWARTGLPQALSSATYNAANQQTKWGTTNLTYDTNGNLTSDGTNTYTWNARNQLTSMTGPGLTASFQYDPLGRRTNKTINGSSTSFLYDGVNPVQEKSGITPVANILSGLGIDEYLARTDSSGTSYFLPDAIGSTMALVDSTGTVQTAYTYEPFGKATFSGAASTNPFQYTGRENDGTGLYYHRARYYSPTMQRFVSEDPLKLLGNGTSLYLYAANNPLSWIDPTGLTSWPTDYGTVTGPFGEPRPSGPHTGVDIRNPNGGDVYASDSGTVQSVFSNPRGGKQIIILNGDGTVSGYAHTSSTVVPGQHVDEGQVIGNSDGSGGVAPHLHYTYRPCEGCPKEDPLNHLPPPPPPGGPGGRK